MKALILSLGITCLCFLSSSGSPAIESNDNTVQSTRTQVEESFLRKLNTKCSERDNHSCVMLKLIVYMNRMFKKSSIDIGDNIKVTETSTAEDVKTQDVPDDDLLMMARAFKSDDDKFGVIIADKLWKYVRSRTMRYKVNKELDFVVSMSPQESVNIGLTVNPGEALESGRGRIKNLAPLIAAIATKVGLIGALAIKGLVILVGKALITSKIALVLAAILWLKKLLSKKTVTYEVVPHAHHTSSDSYHNSYSPGWGRALNSFLDDLNDVPGDPSKDAQEHAYSAVHKS